MNQSSIKARYWIAAVSLALLMAGPFVASALYAWVVGTEEHRAIFRQYFQQVFPLGLVLTALATALASTLRTVTAISRSVNCRTSSALRTVITPMP